MNFRQNERRSILKIEILSIRQSYLIVYHKSSLFWVKNPIAEAFFHPEDDQPLAGS